MSARTDFIAAQQKLISVALDIAATERHLADDDRAALMLATLDDALAYAARDLANAIAELRPDDRPAEWDTSPDGETA
jgi:hypothetical protein